MATRRVKSGDADKVVGSHTEHMESSSSTDQARPTVSDDDQPCIVIELSRNKVNAIIGVSAALILFASICVATYVNFSSYDPMTNRMIEPEALSLFLQHDYNEDGYLEPREFEPLAHVIMEGNTSLSYDQPISPEDNIITVSSHLNPLNLSSMSIVTKGVRALDKLDQEKPLTGLLSWKEAVSEFKNFATQSFTAFLPKNYEENMPELGSPYHITPFGADPDDPLETRLGRVSSNRLYPPRVTGHLTTLHNLLAMLHPRPFLNLRFAPRGALSCLRGYNDEWLDISFRMHAEFQLNEPPLKPFWFTPAQFKGRLIISKDLKRIKYFNMHVPSNRRLNVDMEWLKGSQAIEMEVDIGYMPQMELRGTGPSRPATWEGEDLRNAFKPELVAAEDELDDLEWSKEVQVDVCTRAMDIVFYPFQKVPYYNYTEAFDLAAKENKLIHSIVLWGALDDQSC